MNSIYFNLFCLLTICLIVTSSTSVSAYKLAGDDKAELLERFVRRPGWGKRDYGDDENVRVCEDLTYFLKIKERLEDKLEKVTSTIEQCAKLGN